MSKKRRLHPLEIAEKNASFDILGYIRKKLEVQSRTRNDQK